MRSTLSPVGSNYMGPLMSKCIVLLILELFLLSKLSGFIVEPVYNDGSAHSSQNFIFGVYSLPETKLIVSQDPSSIYDVMVLCAGDSSTEYTMQRLTSISGLTLRDTVIVT